MGLKGPMVLQLKISTKWIRERIERELTILQTLKHNVILSLLKIFSCPTVAVVVIWVTSCSSIEWRITEALIDGLRWVSSVYWE